MADYKFNFTANDSLESRRDTIASRIANAQRYVDNVDDPRFKQGGQEKLDYYMSEQDKLNEQFKEASGGGAQAQKAKPTPYSVYDDPNYQAALAGAQSQFNMERIGALGSKQYQDLAIERTLENRPDIAEDQRQRLAGNFASRGMGGGRYGALTRAEAELNAGELAQRTGLREQMAELDRQFTAQFGAEGTDWLGTMRGQQAQQNAIQQALAARLGGLSTV